MQGRRQRQRRALGGQPSGYPCPEVVDVRQGEQLRAGGGVIQRLAQRRQHAADGRGGVDVLLDLLGRSEQRRREPGVFLGGRAPRHRPGQDQRAHLVAFPADQQLRGGAHEAAAGEGVAVGVAAGEAAEDRPRVDDMLGRGVDVAREHHLAQVTTSDPGHGGGDRALVPVS